MDRKYTHEELIRLYIREVMEQANIDVAEEIIHPNFRNSFPNTSLKWGWLMSMNRFQYLDNNEGLISPKDSAEVDDENPIRQKLFDIFRANRLSRDKNEKAVDIKFTIKRIVIAEDRGSVYFTHHYTFSRQPNNSTLKFKLNTKADGDAVMFIEFQDNKIIALDFIADYLSIYYSLNATFLNLDQLRVVDNYLKSLEDI